MSSTERATNDIERVAGAARARIGDMTREERSRAERVIQQDEAQGGRSGQRVQEAPRDVTDRSFTG